jgi:hypothetical protein
MTQPIATLIALATSTTEIERLEDLYCDYCDYYKDVNGFRPHNKDVVTERAIQAFYEIHLEIY